MTREIFQSPDAEKDFKSILKYLQVRWNNQITRRFINKVEENIDLILSDPPMFPLINEQYGIRKSVLTKQNTLFYREKNDRIEIIRLFDTRQDPTKLDFLK